MLDAVLALNGLDTQVFDKVALSSVPQGDAPDYITVPDAHLLFNGEFKRVGSTGLKITGEDGQSYFIEDYFSGETHKHLLSPEGAMLSAHVVGALAGPLAPGQMAQAGAQPAAQAVIGRVDAISGSCTVVRNGVTVSLNMGDTVRKGDVVQTSGSSAISIVFTDGSTFSLSANARMVLDEFVYNAAGGNNSAVINLVQGTFSFVAGQVAKTGDMRIDTPVATMGIRGTAVLVEISANDGQTKFSVMVEPNGTTGSFNLYNKTTGALLATVNNSQIGWLVTPAGPLQVVAQQVDKTPAQLQQELGIVQQLFNIFNNYQQNPLDPNQQQDPNRRGDNPGDPQTTGSVGSGGGPGSNQPSNYTVTITQIPGGNYNSQNPPTPAGTNTNTNPNPNSYGAPESGLLAILQQGGTFNVINGTDGNDFIIGTPGNDYVLAGDGDDIIIAAHGAGNDVYDGGNGVDTIKYESAVHGVTFHLNAGTTTLPGGQVVKSSTADGVDVGHDIFVRMEKIVGSPGNDIFVLHDGGEWEIDAGAGIDIVRFADGLDLVNLPGGPNIENFEIVDLKTDQTVDANGISNIAHFDVSDLGNTGTDIGGHKVLRVLGDNHDRISVGNQYGFQGTWTQTQDNVSGNFADGLTEGVVFDVYTWTFGNKIETVYLQDGILINMAPVFDDGPKTNVFGKFALTEYQGVESLKLTSGAIDEDTLEFDLGLAPTAAGSSLFENLAPGGVTPTKGSGATFDFQLNAGESVTTQWLFDADDYLPYDDFAFVAVTFNGQIVYSSLLSDVSNTGNYGQTPWTFVGYSAPADGTYHVTFGVMDSGDDIRPSDLYIAPPHITLAPIVEDNGTEALSGGLQLLQLLGRLGLSAEPQTEWLQATRFIEFSDADPFDAHSVQVELTSPNSVGHVSAELVLVGGVQQIRLDYLIDNKNVQYLGAGQNLYQDVKIVLSDGTDFAEKYYTVAIKGQNDNPEIVDVVDEYSVSAPAGTPGVPLVFSNNFAFTDLDINDTHTVTFTLSAGSNVASSLGTFVPTKLADTANGTGGLVHWEYTVDPALVNALERGSVRIEAYDITVSDGHGGSSTHQITITLNGPPNQAPVANGETLAGPFNEDTPVSFSSSLLLANDTDAEGDSLIVLGFGDGEDAADSATTAHGGTIAFSSSGITYTPAADYNGPDSFIYWISDQHGGFRQATATLNVAPVNDVPVTNAASGGSGAEDTAIAIVLSGSDVEGTLGGFQLTTLPANGTLFYDINHTQPVATSGGTASITTNANSITLYFVPNADWNGATSFSYAAVDGANVLGPVVNVPITVTAVNDAPAGTDKTITILEDLDHGYSFSASDFGYLDVENDAFAYLKIESLPDPDRGALAYGTQIVTAGDIANGFEIAAIHIGRLKFIPAADGTGNGYASFTFQVRDATGLYSSAPNTITFDVTPVNDAPFTNAASGSGDEDNPIAIVLSGSDIEGTLKGFHLSSLPANGSLFYDAAWTQAVVISSGTADITTNNANSVTLYFKPNADWNGSTSFSYAAVDANDAVGNSNTASINVTAVNDAPVFTGDPAASVRMSESYTLATSDLGYTDIDDDASGIVFTVSNQVNGMIKVNGDVATTFTAADVAAGHVTFLQNGTEAATASFAFTMDDGNEDNSPAFASTFNFEVTMSARPETNAPLTVTASEDQAAAIEIVLTGSDADGSVASYRIVSAPEHGKLYSETGVLITNSVAATGDATDNYQTRVYFRPDANWDGSTSVQFAAVDDRGFADLSPATVKIDVTPAVDDATFSFGRGSVNLIVNGGFSSGLSGWSSYFDNSAFYTTTAYQVFDSAGALFVYNLPGPLSGAYALAAPPLQAVHTFDGVSTLQQSFEVPYALEDLKISYDFFVVGRFSQPQNGTSLTSLVYGTTQFARIDVLKSGSAPYDTSPTAVVDNLFNGRTMAGNSLTSGSRQEFASPSWLHNEFTAGADLASLTSDQIYILRFANVTTFFAPQQMGIDNVSVVAQIGSVGYQNGGDIVIGKIALGDTDGSEQLTKLVLSGFATGFVFKIGGNPAGALQSDGTWVITDRGQLDALATTDLMATLPANYTGVFTITSVATVTDTVVMSNGQTQSATRDFTDTLKVEILVPNDAPTSADKLITIDEDAPRILSAADFPFSDINGDTFFGVKIVSLPDAGAGTLKLNGVAVAAGDVISATAIAANLLVFTPGTNLSGAGAASFTFQVQDNGGSGGFDADSVGTDLSAVKTMSFNVMPIADAANFPAPAAGAIVGNEDNTISLRTLDLSLADPSETLKLVLDNFPPGSVFKIDGVQVGALDTTSGSPTFNKWVISDAGQIAALHDHMLQFTPPANYNGRFDLNITAITTDAAEIAGAPVESQNTVTRTLDITVTSINDLPVAGNDAFTIDEDTPLTIPAATLLANDSDIETPRASLVISAVSNPAGGVIELNGGNPKFTPTGGFSGIAGFDYTITDANGGTAAAHVTVNVAPVADAAVFSFATNIAKLEDLDIVIGKVRTFETDGTESLTKLTLSGFPAGVVFLLNGQQVGGLVGNNWVIDNANDFAALVTADLSMRPLPNYFGDFTLTSIATIRDTAGSLSDSRDFSTTTVVHIENTPDNVLLNLPTADQTAYQGAPFSLQLDSQAFIDPDRGAITYVAALENGDPLPSWLAFNPATRTFSGSTPDMGTLSVKVVATGSYGSTASDIFVINVADNAIPTAAALQFTIDELSDARVTLAGSDADTAQGDTLSYKFTDIPGGISVFADAAHTIAISAGQLFAGPDVYIVSSDPTFLGHLSYVAVDSHLAQSTPAFLSAVLPEPAIFTGTAGDDIANAVTRTVVGFTGGTDAQIRDRVGDIYLPGDGTDVVVAGRGDDTLRFVSQSNFSAFDSFNGGNGTDTIDIGGMTAADIRDISFSNIENLTGGDGSNHLSITLAQFSALSSINLGGGDDKIDVFLPSSINASGVPTNYDISNLALPTLSGVERVNLLSTGSGNQSVTVSYAQAALFSGFDFGDGGDDRLIIKSQADADGRIWLLGDKFANIETVTYAGSDDPYYPANHYRSDGQNGSLAIASSTKYDFVYLDSAYRGISDPIPYFNVERSGANIVVSFKNDVITVAGDGSFEAIGGYGGGTLVVGLEGLAEGRSIVVGNAANDIITGHGVANLFFGGGGNDTITGVGDSDIYYGGTGNDTLINIGNNLNNYVFFVGDGSDTINDGSGTSGRSGDSITIDTRGAALTTFSVGRDATNANLKITYDGGDVTVLNQFIEHQFIEGNPSSVLNPFAGTGAIETVGFNGGSFAGFNFGVREYLIVDAIQGGQVGGYNLLMVGQNGHQYVGSNGAINTLNDYSLTTKDILVGGDQNDTLVTTGYGDLLIGGGGADKFVFTSQSLDPSFAAAFHIEFAPAIIADFVQGTDKIGLSGFNWSAISAHYDATLKMTSVDVGATIGAIKLAGDFHLLTENDFIFT